MPEPVSRPAPEPAARRDRAADRAWIVPLSPYGLREIAGVTVAAAVAGAVVAWVWWPASVPVGLVWLGAILFFRDPSRRVPQAPGEWLAPADGRVTEITRIERDERLGAPAVRIGIFLSVLDVHINRSPCEAVVGAIEYRPGRFHNAMHPVSSTDNESNTLVLDGGPAMGRCVVRQVAGLIARRIVCAASSGDRLAAGQRFGMIKFGSRTELILSDPDRIEIAVRVGDKARAGVTVLARLRDARAVSA